LFYLCALCVLCIELFFMPRASPARGAR